MVKQFVKSNHHTVEIGRQQHQMIDVNSDKYRILFGHVHILALACAMVGTFFHIIMTFEDFKKGLFYRMIRHIPCAILFAFVVVGNRTMKPFFYYFYLILNFVFVAFIIIYEIVVQYVTRTDPEKSGHENTLIAFYVLLWCFVVIIEMIIYYIIYRDFKFVKEIKGTPAMNQKIIPFRFQDQTVPVISRY